MKEFRAAAKHAAGEQEELDLPPIVLPDGTVENFTISIPTTGQISLVAASMDAGGVEMLGAVYNFLRGLMTTEDYRRFRGLVADGTIPFELVIGGDELNEDGIIDWIIENSTDRPTKAPTDFLPSQKTGGQRSTGRSPGRGSTRSTSTRAAS